MLAPLHADGHVDQSGLTPLLCQRFRGDVEHRPGCTVSTIRPLGRSTRTSSSKPAPRSHSILLLTEITASTEASAQPVPSRSSRVAETRVQQAHQESVRGTDHTTRSVAVYRGCPGGGATGTWDDGSEPDPGGSRPRPRTAPRGRAQ